MNITQNTIQALTIAALCFFSGNLTHADDDLAKINAANQALVDGKLDEAVAQYDAIAETMPGSPLLAYNRGVALYRQGQVDQARQAFVTALDTGDRELAAKASFNLGNCHYAAAMQQSETERPVAINSLQKAIAHYQSTLQSNTADTDSRTNIELAHRLIKKLQQEEEQRQKQQDQNQDSQNQDSNQSEQDQDNQSDSQDQKSGEQDSDESNPEKSKSDEDQSDEPSSQKEDDQQKESGKSESEKSDSRQSEADKNVSDESSSGEQTDEDNQSEEDTDGSNADQSERQDSAGSENNEQNQQSEQGESGQRSDQPQPEEQQDGQQPQPQSGEEQPENKPEQTPGQKMSAGNADQQDQPDDGQQASAYGISHSGEPGENIDKEEAMKMLQAIRDRDLMRRMQKLNETRRRYRPVDRDW